MLTRECGAESNGKLPDTFIPGEAAAFVPEFAVEGLPLVELPTWFLSLQRKTCLWQNCNLGSCACSEGPTIGQNSLMAMMMMMMMMMMNLSIGPKFRDCSPFLQNDTVCTLKLYFSVKKCFAQKKKSLILRADLITDSCNYIFFSTVVIWTYIA